MLYRRVMSARARISAVVLATVTALALGGCVPSELDPTSSPEPTATPVFASEEEALAAATDAYAAYQAALDQAFADWNVGPLGEVAADEALETSVSAVDKYESSGRRQVGTSTVDTTSLVNGDAALDPATNSTQMYACLDVGKVDVVDSSGISVVPVGRPLRYPILVSLTWSSNGRFVISDEEQWQGKNFCV